MQGGQSREGEGAEVANVSVVVDTWPGGVHANEIGVERRRGSNPGAWTVRTSSDGDQPKPRWF